MTIALSETEVSARTLKRGDGNFTLQGGKRLRIQKWGPGAEDLLDTTVPEGKQWAVSIFVSVVETDA